MARQWARAPSPGPAGTRTGTRRPAAAGGTRSAPRTCSTFPTTCPSSWGRRACWPGTHLYANIHHIVPEQVVLRDIPAGTAILADFDVGHAGTPNRTDVSRYMLKFVVLRMEAPGQATWDHRDPAWRTPEGLRTPHDLPGAWTSLWNWLRGARRAEGIEPPPTTELPCLLDALRSPEQGARLAALYDLAAMGPPALEPLTDALLATAGLDRHVAPPKDDPRYYAKSEDHLGSLLFAPAVRAGGCGGGPWNDRSAGRGTACAAARSRGSVAAHQRGVRARRSRPDRRQRGCGPGW